MEVLKVLMAILALCLAALALIGIVVIPERATILLLLSALFGFHAASLIGAGPLQNGPWNKIALGMGSLQILLWIFGIVVRHSDKNGLVLLALGAGTLIYAIWAIRNGPESSQTLF